MFYKRYRDDFAHFEKTILNGYYNEYYYKKNDSIWIWENTLAPDRYAMGKEDVLKRGLYIKRFFINLLFIIIAIFSFFWIKKNIKFK